MTIDQIREVHDARPFKPFTLVIADGSRIHVPHPEFMAHPGKGRIISVFDARGVAKIIDLLMVTYIEMGKDERGRRRRAG